MIRPCPVAASVAAHCAVDDGYDERLTERAREALVDDMMRGEEFPRRAFGPQINLMDVLMSCDREALAQAVFKEVTDGPAYELSGEVKKLVEAYFEQHGHHVIAKAEELRAEDREDAEQAAVDRMLLERESE